MAVETVRTSFMRQPRRNCPMHKARNPGVLSARLQLFCSKKNIAAAPKYNDLLLVESACGAQKQSRIDISCPGEGKIGLREIGETLRQSNRMKRRSVRHAPIAPMDKIAELAAEMRQAVHGDAIAWTNG